jgi:hypothetical protein
LVLNCGPHVFRIRREGKIAWLARWKHQSDSGIVARQITTRPLFRGVDG